MARTLDCCVHACYIAICLLLAADPELYLPLHVVSSWLEPWKSTFIRFQGAASGSTALPDTAVPHVALHLPSTRHAAWQLGHLAGLLEAGSVDEAEATAKASGLLKLPHHQRVTPQQLQQLGDLLQAAESPSGSTLKALLGVLSLVNIIWAVGIAGICITIGPVAYIVLEPMMQAVHALLFQLAAVLNVLLRLAGQAIQLLLKVATVLQPLYPAVGYILCANIVAVAGSCEPDTAAFVALTGQGLAVALITYETLADVRQSRSASFAAVILATTAVAHQSQLAGFLAVVGLFSALGFAELAAAVLLLGLLGCRLLGGSTCPAAWQNPFQLGVSVMGSNCLFLAGIIRSSAWYHGRDEKQYLVQNLGFLALIATCVAASALLGMAALRNTAVTYAALWMSQKVVEVTAGKAMWVTMFFASLALWCASMFLASHPEWLVSLLQL